MFAVLAIRKTGLETGPGAAEEFNVETSPYPLGWQVCTLPHLLVQDGKQKEHVQPTAPPVISLL